MPKETNGTDGTTSILSLPKLNKASVVCAGIACTIYRQIVGTAMGMSFSVVYAVIFMIWLETPIVNDIRFRQYIQLDKQFIDDLFLIWTGSAAVLCDFRRAPATADEAISQDSAWTGAIMGLITESSGSYESLLGDG